MRARDLMSTGCVAVTADNSVSRAARMMLDHRVSGLPVLGDDGRLVGIVTEGDLLRRAELGGGEPSRLRPAEERARSYLKSRGWKVGDVMSRDLVTVEEDTPVERIAALMAEYGIRRVPVRRGEALVGIVSRRDLLKVVCATMPDEVASGDEALKRSIRTRLAQDLRLGDDQVRVSVADGVVRLRGSVGSEAEREAALAVAEGVCGVAGVELDIAVATIGLGR